MSADKSPSQHVSEVLSDLVENLSKQMMVRLDHFSAAQERMNKDINDLRCEISEVKAKMPTQPCRYHTEINKIVLEHIKEHDKRREQDKILLAENRKFYRQIIVIVLGIIITGGFSVLWFGIKAMLATG